MIVSHANNHLLTVSEFASDKANYHLKMSSRSLRAKGLHHDFQLHYRRYEATRRTHNCVRPPNGLAGGWGSHECSDLMDCKGRWGVGAVFLLSSQSQVLEVTDIWRRFCFANVKQVRRTEPEPGSSAESPSSGNSARHRCRTGPGGGPNYEKGLVGATPQAKNAQRKQATL